MAAAARRELERHLAGCRTCTVLYDSTRRTIRLVTDCGAFDLPGPLSDRLATRVRAAITPATRPGDDA